MPSVVIYRVVWVGEIVLVSAVPTIDSKRNVCTCVYSLSLSFLINISQHGTIMVLTQLCQE